MVPILALAVLQLAIGHALAPYLIRYVAGFGAADPYVVAAAFALLVWVTGWLGAAVLKGVARPRPGVLAAALIGALGCQALTSLPAVAKALAGVAGGAPPHLLVLLAATAGYAIAARRH